jgi:hypothetical protein
MPQTTQNMRERMDSESVNAVTQVATCTKKDRRGISALSKKIYGIVSDVIMPMSSTIPTLPLRTTFSFTEQENMVDIIKVLLRRDCPLLLEDKALFMKTAEDAYNHAVL